MQGAGRINYQQPFPIKHFPKIQNADRLSNVLQVQLLNSGPTSLECNFTRKNEVKA